MNVATIPVTKPVTRGPGFTPFAHTHLLLHTGHVADYAMRTYVLGGSSLTGKRLREERVSDLTTVWFAYVESGWATLLWVKWSDGKRHLVHRKEA